VSVLEEPEDGCADELELAPEPVDGAGAALELDEELESLGCVVEPAPAEPLGVAELELDGAVLDEDDEEPPLALSFFWMSIEVDEELEPGAVLGAVVVPEAELEDEPGAVLGAVVAPEPDGEVVDEDEVEPAGVREALSDLLQPLITAAPNARVTARARVETFMGPPWLGYGKEGARIGPRMLRSHQAA
jgi:hypothetical protein